jgi:hypothetical protein
LDRLYEGEIVFTAGRGCDALASVMNLPANLRISQIRDPDLLWSEALRAQGGAPTGNALSGGQRLGLVHRLLRYM